MRHCAEEPKTREQFEHKERILFADFESFVQSQEFVHMEKEKFGRKWKTFESLYIYRSQSRAAKQRNQNLISFYLSV